MAEIFVQGPQGKVAIGDGRPVFVIAEIGKNFIQTEEDRSTEEYLQNAIALVRAAKEAGAHAVKFQTHNVEDEQAAIEVTSPHFKGADRYRWLTRNTSATPIETFWKPLKRVCDELGIIFFSTPMSRGAAEKLTAIDPPLWKIGSGDLLDFVLLDYIRQSGKPIMLSTGMSTIAEIDRAVEFLREKTDQIILLHCVSRYPCPPEELRLKTIEFLKQRYDLPVGFSDHSIGTDSAIAAAALGAVVIEKHFSFDRELWGSDHKVSLLPNELRTLVAGVERVRQDAAYRETLLASPLVVAGLGSMVKVMDEQEMVFRPFFRKTLAAATDVPAGTILEARHLYAMRPQAYLKGLPSEDYPAVIGRRLTRDLKHYHPIRAEFLETTPVMPQTTQAPLQKRKVCVVVINRANYGRIKTALTAIEQHPALELQLIAGSSLLLDRFGKAADIVRSHGFKIDAEVHMAVEGETPLTMAKSVGLGILEITNALHHLKPDIVLTIADRFETIATATAASYMNIPVAHTQGGEVTGSIDESVRHAVTKLAHVHFPATRESAERLIKMGEDPAMVFMTGCPAIDIVADMSRDFTQEELERITYMGVGATVDVTKPYLLLMQHPVTTEYGSGREQVMETIEAMRAIGMPVIALWPNIDAGSDDISKAFRMLRERHADFPIRFYKNFSPETYARILANAACAVGNSSSFIREGSFLGLPAVLVGSRQQGREHGHNALIDVPHERQAIEAAIRQQLAHGRYTPDHRFGDGKAGERIAEILATAEIKIQKRLAY